MDDSEPHASTSASKRPRPAADFAYWADRFEEEALTPLQTDSYQTLPAPTRTHIRLRFQLARFKGVYRVVRVPLTFTFSNLHMLVQFLFGWSDKRSHCALVYAPASLYSGNYKAGEINLKKSGSVAPLPDWIDPEDEREVYFWELRPASLLPRYKVVAQGKRKGIKETNYGWNDQEALEPNKEDQEVRVKDVWYPKLERNVSAGECGHREIAVHYMYPIGDPWDIHITCDRDEPFLTLEEPSNLPSIITAKGAPPNEFGVAADPTEEGECIPQEKTMDAGFQAPDAFARYTAGELITQTRKTRLMVCTPQEKREKDERGLQRMRERQAERQAKMQARTRGEGGNDEDELDSEEGGYDTSDEE